MLQPNFCEGAHVIICPECPLTSRVRFVLRAAACTCKGVLRRTPPGTRRFAWLSACCGLLIETPAAHSAPLMVGRVDDVTSHSAS
jgi:hypothetical protein